MDEDKKVSFDKDYIEKLYTRYLATGRVQNEHRDELHQKLKGNKVILVAPGKSSVEEKNKIERENGIVISVNFDYPLSDFIFLSNLRRYRELPKEKYAKCIATSNITADGVYLQTKYRELLNNVEAVRDNAGLMAIKFLMNYGVSEIMLAGFDGYDHNVRENFADKRMEFYARNAIFDAMNEGMKAVLDVYSKEIKITFLTTPRHIGIQK